MVRVSCEGPPIEYVRAREVLLDALEALEPHLDAVGAQAVYLHTGAAQLSVAPTTTDADIVLAPDRLLDEPLLEEALRRAGFVPGASGDPGSWRGRFDVAVDVMVPEALAGEKRRRSVVLPVHGKQVARRTLGLEPAIVDNTVRALSSLDGAGERRILLRVAGPAALLVAKLIKVAERRNQKVSARA